MLVSQPPESAEGERHRCEFDTVSASGRWSWPNHNNRRKYGVPEHGHGSVRSPALLSPVQLQETSGSRRDQASSGPCTAGRGPGNYDTPNTTYYFTPGIHTLGTNVNDQIPTGPNDWYVGERSGGQAAIIDGQRANNYGSVSQTGDADWTEYLTVEHFVGDYASREPNANGAACNRTIKYDTVQDNYPGSGFELAPMVLQNTIALRTTATTG